MALYSKESLEALRQKIDLGEVISSYIKMQRSGASYKGLCPFHEEKTASFFLHKGDSHYHCFGCGAHGDAITFLMEYAKMTFIESLEFLSERFQSPLEKIEKEESTGPSKARLKQVLERANVWFRFFLLHSTEGKQPLLYLYQRGLSLRFLKKFEVGYAPEQGEMLLTLLREEGFTWEELFAAGLVRETSGGRKKDFFSSRIMFPIRDKIGSVIGFSARKIKEEVYGGKYINTAETPLFKKSKVLFGLCYSRQKIAKERKALIVEGQIDALRLIDQGFDWTVAGQGTAFGEGHAKELLQLGVKHVFLALDGDFAGREASIKIGSLFQSQGAEVSIVELPAGSDPDSFLQEMGKEAFAEKIQQGKDYLSFYYHHLCQGQDLSSPSKKSEIVMAIAAEIQSWEQPLMIHESLKKLGEISNVPQDILGNKEVAVVSYTPKNIGSVVINPDKVLEMTLLRWMMLSGEKTSRVVEMVRKNLSVECFKHEGCARLFSLYLSLEEKVRGDWMFFAGLLDKQEEQILLNELLQSSVLLHKVEEGVVETIHKLLQRAWMDRREQIHKQMSSSGLSEEEMMALAKQYDTVNKNSPKVILPEEEK